MNTLTNALSLISNALMLPVIVLLLYFFVATLVRLGGFWGEFLQRLRRRRVSDDVFAALRKSQDTDLGPLREGRGLFARTLVGFEDVRWDPIHADFLLGEGLEEVEQLLARRRLPVRLGPMMGLMGTLIPLGPALTGLAAGDIATMAVNIQVAFATTVIGVAIGALGFVIYSFERRWLLHDLQRLEYLVRLNTRESG
ncbi:MAG: MotA/TolQ/ExbB proton channel family protein [Proteobacteria bacterium]|nr:MotA/TolQ/ExbB proton channel family protein [Pseudomonadota bacterium]MCP4918496.1 MotA/TolQ/ExbB proton channel family protein [Pseudomonadota bacterium]